MRVGGGKEIESPSLCVLTQILGGVSAVQPFLTPF